MDRANINNMKTVNITINTNLASSGVPVLLYTYNHGYSYIPQFWGLWDINYMPNAQSPTYDSLKKRVRGYGYVTHNTGFGFTFNFYYTIDATSIKLYCIFDTFFDPKPNCSGTTAKFTGYLFANGRDNQDYDV